MKKSLGNGWIIERVRRIPLRASQAYKAENALHQAQFFVDLLFAAMARLSGTVAITIRLGRRFGSGAERFFRTNRKRHAARSYGA